MSNEQDASDALLAARTALGRYKSGNKRKKGNPAYNQSRELAAGKISNNRKKAMEYGDMLGDTAEEKMQQSLSMLGGLAKVTGAGDCTEYALAARDFLLGKNPQAKVQIVGLVNGDHTFAVIGIDSDAELSVDVTQWGEDVWICDPWIKVACHCRDYQAKWKEKMDGWKGKGKQIMSANTLYDPAHKSWYNAMETSQKVVYKL